VFYKSLMSHNPSRIVVSICFCISGLFVEMLETDIVKLTVVCSLQ